MSLKEKRCVPCQGGIDPMTRQEAESYLDQTPGWTLTEDGRKIWRRFKLGNFAEAMALAHRVGELAEEQDHHPDICFGWGYTEVTFYTHKIGGLHENDFIMAARINALHGEY